MTLPLIEPPAPGCIDGIVSVDPPRVQCQECGVIADRDSLGLKRGGIGLVVICSGIRFHAKPWPDGNPRLCRACRVSRGCTCVVCAWERRSL